MYQLRLPGDCKFFTFKRVNVTIKKKKKRLNDNEDVSVKIPCSSRYLFVKLPTPLFVSVNFNIGFRVRK